MDPGKKRYFTAQFMRHQNRVFAFIVTLLPDRNEAEEAFQETGLLLWENWEQFDRDREFVPWACGFAFNVVRTLRRKKQRSPAALSVDVLEAVAETRYRTEELLALRRKALSVCMAKLTDDQRSLVRQCYLGNRNLRTVAEHIRIAPQTLYKRLQRIRRRLFECIDRQMRQEVAT